MPNPYITKNSKIPISGPKAYIDGGDRGHGKTVLQTTPNNYQIGRLQGVRSVGSSTSGTQKSNGGVSGAVRGALAGAAPMPPSVQEEVKRRVNTAAQSSAGGGAGGAAEVAPGTVAPGVSGGTVRQETLKVETPEAMSYEDYFKKVGGDVYESELQKAIAARVQQAADAYGRQKEQAGAAYEDAARQAYINNMMSQRNLDQQLAAGGIYGGMADSQRIAMDANYQNEVADLERQYIETLADLDQAITDARLAGDTQAAEQMASYKTAVQSQYANYLLQKDQQAANVDQWQREYEAQLELQRQQAARQAAVDGASYGGGTSGGYDNGSLSASQVAEMQRALGVTPDGLWGSRTSTAANGMSANEAWQAYQAAYQAAKRKTGGYSSGGGGVNTMMTK